MVSLQSRLKSILRVAWMPDLLTALGALTYIVQTVFYAHSQDSVLDEGLYLLKGYLFATGKYTPYQPYGPWTNKMPFSFLIPGFAQKIMGPGLRTGRYYAIGMSLLFLVGIWILGRRLGGSWGGAVVVWVMALNPANLKLYSMALSEGLVATMLVWVLVLTLGRDRPLWQALIGSALAGLIPLTRINISPVLLLMVLYIFWERGLKEGVYVAVSGLGTFLVGFWIFSPGIIPWWLMWIPEKFTPFLNEFRWNYAGGQPVRISSVSYSTKMKGVFEVVRLHFVAITGLFLTMIFLPKLGRDHRKKKIVYFLIGLFLILFLVHGWYSFIRSSFPHGFSVYLSFFNFIGVLVLISSLREWKQNLRIFEIVLASIYFGFVLVSIYVPSVIKGTTVGQIVEGLLRTNALEINDQMMLDIAPWQWWEIFKGKFSWPYQKTFTYGASLLLSILIGISLFLSYQLMGYFKKTFFYNNNHNGFDFRQFSLGVLVMGLILSPSELLGGGRDLYECNIKVIPSYEQAGKHIREYIQPGEKVYWQGGDTQAVLLELGEIELYPQPLNTSFNLRMGGDSDQLARRGLWNMELKSRWIKEADVVLIEERAGGNNVEGMEENSHLKKVSITSQIGCRSGSNIVILRRVP